MRRSFGLVAAAALVVGNMVGSGVYLLPASLAPYGGWSLGGWGVTTVGAVLLALVFSRLARRLPRTGGPYAYARAGFGNLVGFLVAWGYWISLMSAGGAVAVAFTGYLSAFVPALARLPLLGAGMAVVTVWFVTLVNLRGVRHGARLQVVMTGLKLVPLLAIGLVGLWHFHPASLFASTHGASAGPAAINASAALTLAAFMGLESATVPARSVRDARRTIPRATMIGTLVAAGVYILSTTVVMGLVPHGVLAQSTAPFAEAGRRLWGGWAGYLMAAGGVVACFGTLNGVVLIQAHVPQAAAGDGLFPRPFLKDSRWSTPLTGLIVSALFVSFLVASNYARGLVGLFTFVIRLATLSSLIPYLVATAADWALLGSRARSRRTRFRMALIDLGAAAYSMWAIAGIGLEATSWGLLLLLAGVPLFLWVSFRQKRKEYDA